MGQISEEVRRPRGRPQIRCDDDTRQLIIEAAAQEFQANGYAAAGMCAVAARAGVSTKTLYRLIPTKADLFRSVVSDRIGRFMLEIDAQALDGLDPAHGLEHILNAYGRLTLDAETVPLIRLVVGECGRFPELGATFYEVAIRRTSDAMADWLREQSRRGLISIDDPNAASGMLRGMMTMEPQRAVMLGQRAVPDAAEIAARAKSCARIFLDGCRAAPRDAISGGTASVLAPMR
jgi:AcrR family transcriptional regulator